MFVWGYCRTLPGAAFVRYGGSGVHDLPLREICDPACNSEFRVSRSAQRHTTPYLYDLTRPTKVPLSAFIAEDMNEFVHAHATYRFVVFDEEEERPRILIWLFKPTMKLSYAVQTQYVIPKSGAIRAAKVLYKILDTASVYSDLDGLVLELTMCTPRPTDRRHRSVLKRYPGFPQAEHLYYPRGICRRLGALLKESNTACPENMRTITGLDVGWLQRA